MPGDLGSKFRRQPIQTNKLFTAGKCQAPTVTSPFANQAVQRWMIDTVAIDNYEALAFIIRKPVEKRGYRGFSWHKIKPLNGVGNPTGVYQCPLQPGGRKMIQGDYDPRGPPLCALSIVRSKTGSARMRGSGNPNLA